METINLEGWIKNGMNSIGFVKLSKDCLCHNQGEKYLLQMSWADGTIYLESLSLWQLVKIKCMIKIKLMNDRIQASMIEKKNPNFRSRVHASQWEIKLFLFFLFSCFSKENYWIKMLYILSNL